MKHNWNQIHTLESKKYICGYCGSDVSSEKAYYANNNASGRADWKIYICHHCEKPTFFDEVGVQAPGRKYGSDVENIDDESVLNLYNEARDCMVQSAYTASGMCCRKLLMHIAVSKSAEEGKKFAEYVNYLEENNYTPPGSKDWVDEIRKTGNSANHEIVFLSKQQAENLISFSEMLLKFIYEFPGKVKK